MKRAITKLARTVLPQALKMHLTLAEERSALVQRGWFRSRREAMCVDANGDPIPWYTYAAISFLDERVPSDAHVFEFGMGNSTLWWAKHAADVQCVEGDATWFNLLALKLPANVHPVLEDAEGDAYAQAAVRQGTPVDILVIDGRQRVRCCKESLPVLTDRGVVVWDNAERERYADGQRQLLAQGFRRLDFWSMGPLNTYEWLTSIFYRDGNLLGI